MTYVLNKRSDFITFARGYAIFTIVLYHCFSRIHINPILDNAFFFGGAGVHLFIFISGFCLYLSENKSLSEYIAKRVSKILIPYYIILTFIFLLNILIPIYDADIYSYLGHIFLYKMFNDKMIFSFGEQFWFLSVIIQFYCVFPYLTLIKNKMGNFKYFNICFIISLCWWIFLYYTDLYKYKNWDGFFLRYLWEFSFGMVLADIYKIRNYNIFKYNTVWYAIIGVLISLISAVLVFNFGDIGKVFNDISNFAGYTLLAISVYKFSDNFIILKKFFLFISKISYSLFLIHILIIDLLVRIFHINTYSINLYIFLTLTLSILIAYFYEKIYTKIDIQKINFNYS